jgi:hypothetical protein
VVNKWASELNRQFLKEVQMTNKYMKKCSTPLAIKEIQIETEVSLHLSQKWLSLRKQEGDQEPV